MPKKVPPQDRKTAPVITMLPVKVRAQVELLAHREKVSVSEIGRRAVTEYLKEQVG